MPLQDYINRTGGYLQVSAKQPSCARQGCSRGRGRLRGGWPVTGTRATASQSAAVRALVLDGSTLFQSIRGKIILAAPSSLAYSAATSADYSNKWSAGRSNGGQAKQAKQQRRPSKASQATMAADEEDEGLQRLMSVWEWRIGQAVVL
jgi:hypothetical protein